MSLNFLEMEKEYSIKCEELNVNENSEEYFIQKTKDIEDIKNSHKKCGEIYMTGTENFKFVCMLCEKTFFTFIEEFLIHVSHCQQTDEICALEFDPLEAEQDYDVKRPYVNKQSVILKKELTESFDFNTDDVMPTDSIEKDDSISVSPKINTLNSTSFIYCDIPKCNKKFKKKESLGIHKRFEHKQDPEVLTVEENDCSKDEANLDNSEETRGEFDRYTCRYCGQRFVRPYKRVEHEFIHTGENPFKCSICGKGFRAERNRIIHERIHENVKPHKCDMCNAAFLLKTNLTQHIQRCHIGEKRFECEFCEKRFYSKTEKVFHERIHTGEKSYLCFECGKSFSVPSKLNTHLKRHTGVKPFKCDQCDKTFFSNKLLKEHLVVHTGEKPFSCKICGSKFSRRKAMLSHLKIHSDFAQYTCTICGKSFKQGPGLYSHMKSHGKVLSKS